MKIHRWRMVRRIHTSCSELLAKRTYLRKTILPVVLVLWYTMYAGIRAHDTIMVHGK